MTTAELKSKILSANAAYREGNPVMADQEFDDLCDELRSSLSFEDWTKFRSTLFEKAGKVKHPYPMGSLEKFKAEEPENLEKWLNGHITTGLNISAKVDGISCRLHYENGSLVSATTRGDGSRGENITDKIFSVNYVPKSIYDKNILDIRGELVILEKDFEGLDFANPRNATAGIVGRKDATEDLKKITFVAYTVFGDRFTKKEQFEFLERNGFYVAWNKTITPTEVYTLTAESFERFNEELRCYVKQPFPYGVDGLVMSDDSYRNEDKLIPENQIAYKINESIADSVVVGIEWTGPSKDGKFVPVALLDPVELAGTIVQKASLYNVDFITKNDIRPGANVKVLKSGEIIPKIVEVNGRKI